MSLRYPQCLHAGNVPHDIISFLNLSATDEFTISLIEFSLVFPHFTAKHGNKFPSLFMEPIPTVKDKFYNWKLNVLCTLIVLLVSLVYNYHRYLCILDGKI